LRQNIICPNQRFGKITNAQWTKNVIPDPMDADQNTIENDFQAIHGTIVGWLVCEPVKTIKTEKSGNFAINNEY
tara:strand:- start:216 stop:437 length:222 start_codon:yes stop_codon:yes gene_type:complete